MNEGPAKPRPLVFAAATIAVGFGAGLGGMVMALLLHAIQHVAYGYDVGLFLAGSTAARPGRRVAAMAACGLLAGAGGWALRRFGRPIVGISEVVRADGPDLPAAETLADATIQIATVALGSPLGREVAPRQAAAVVAKWIARVARLPTDTVRLLIGCGAGAGFAAVYNVPLGGAVYTLEVVLKSFAPTATIAAITTSVIAARVAWLGLGNERTYEVVPFELGPSLVAWSVVAGPLFGAVAYVFARLAGVARVSVPRPERLLPWCVVTFLAIGVVAMWFPRILGNGRGPAQLGFASQLAVPLAGVLFALKLAAALASLRAGAHGGLLTPSLALGSLLATVLGALWSLAWPGAPLGAFAVVGAAAFLAAAQKMPLTAAVLTIEFTRVGHDAFVPILLAVGGAAAAREACARWDPWAHRQRASKEMRAVASPQGTTTTEE